jgi:hypothetical protein
VSRAGVAALGLATAMTLGGGCGKSSSDSPAAKAGASGPAGGEAGPATTVDRAKAFGALTPDEAKQVCEDLQRYGRRQLARPNKERLACFVQALSAIGTEVEKAAAASACTQAFTACLAKPPEDKPADCASPQWAKITRDCKDATVGEFVDSLTERAALTATWAKTEPCGAVDDKTSALVQLMETLIGPKAKAFQAKCKPT